MKYLFSFLILFVGSVNLSFSTEVHASDPTKPFVVVLDAGHGGRDPGKVAKKYREADIALSIALKVGAHLEKLPNVKVIYTRKTDVFLELRERAAIANRNNADLFVSVHCNAHNSQAHVAESYVLRLHKNQAIFDVPKRRNEGMYLEENYEEKYDGLDPNALESLTGLMLIQEAYLDQSIMLASLVQNKIVNNLNRKDRSVKQAGFWVLHNTYMPSVLIETGFLTNTSEGAYLNSAKGQEEMGREIANAIKKYIESLTESERLASSRQLETSHVEETIATTQTDIYKDVVFKVQIAASSRKLAPKPNNFNGLTDIERVSEDGLFKYYYGSTSDYNKIQVMKTFAQQKGYNTAFVVAYIDGVRTKLAEVLKTKAN